MKVPAFFAVTVVFVLVFCEIFPFGEIACLAADVFLAALAGGDRAFFGALAFFVVVDFDAPAFFGEVAFWGLLVFPDFAVMSRRRDTATRTLNSRFTIIARMNLEPKWQL